VGAVTETVPVSASPSAVVLVRNTAVNDGRVLRAARVLKRIGHRPVVLAVTSYADTAPAVNVDGVQVLRLTPRSPFELARRLRRGAPRGEGVSQHPGAERSGAGGWPTPLIRLHRLLRTLDYYRRAIGLMRAWRPSLVHCNDYNTMWVGVAARLLGSSVIYDAHELWPDRNQRTEPRWWLLLCEAMFVRIANRAIATSPGHAAVIGRRYRVAAPHVIRNIPERVSRGQADPTREPGLIAYAGAVTTNRGLEQAIRSLPNIPRIRLRAIGPGRADYRARLVALAGELGVEARVEFATAVPSDRVVGAIAPAELGLALIQPSCLSYALSLPNKVFEYVAAGLPILAADLPVLGPFVEERGLGLLVIPDDAEDLASKLEKLVEPETNRFYRKTVQQAGQELDWERESRGLIAAYRAAGAPSNIHGERLS
jgi:glycosyltransferase involved in cell wall biosynthesis